MENALVQGDPPIEVDIRSSARAKRMTLRVSQLDGRVTLTIPKGLAEAEARQFIRAKSSWIRKHAARSGGPVHVMLGLEVPIAGQPHLIVAGTGRSILCDAGKLHLPKDCTAPGQAVQSFLRTQARAALEQASDAYARKLGRTFSQIAIRDTRSRWGSCSSKGRLMYSWRLIMAPKPVLDYVAAHEVAHLAEMNHSPAFWAHVQRIYGDYTQPRAWLRSHGHELHRLRFDD